MPKDWPKWKGWLLDAAVLLGVLHVTSVLARRLTFSAVSFDEEWFLWGGDSVLRGLAPYRDFGDFKPPVLFLTEALAIKTFGLVGLRFRLFTSALTLGSILFLAWSLFRRGVNRWIAGALALFVARAFLDPAYHDSSLNDVESIGLAYYLFGLGFLFSRGPRWRWNVAAGAALLAACALTKEPYVLVVVPTCVAFAFLERGTESLRESVKAYATWAFAGGAALTAAVVLYLAAKGGLGAYAEMFRASRAFADSYSVAIGRFHPGTFREVALQNWNHVSDTFVNATNLATWVPLLLAAYFGVSRSRLPFVVLATTALVGGVYAATIGHCYWPHYFVMTISGFALVLAVGADQLQRTLERAAGARPWAGASLMALSIAAVWPRYSTELHGHPEAPPFPIDPAVAAAISSYTMPGDVILTTGSPGIYAFTGRIGAHPTNGFFDELIPLYPGTTDAERLAPSLERFRALRPKVVVLDPVHAQRRNRFMQALFLPFLNGEHYRQVSANVYVRGDLSPR